MNLNGRSVERVAIPRAYNFWYTDATAHDKSRFSERFRVILSTKGSFYCIPWHFKHMHRHQSEVFSTNINDVIRD